MDGCGVALGRRYGRRVRNDVPFAATRFAAADTGGTCGFAPPFFFPFGTEVFRVVVAAVTNVDGGGDNNVAVALANVGRRVSDELRLCAMTGGRVSQFAAEREPVRLCALLLRACALIFSPSSFLSSASCYSALNYRLLFVFVVVVVVAVILTEHAFGICREVTRVKARQQA